MQFSHTLNNVALFALRPSDLDLIQNNNPIIMDVCVVSDDVEPKQAKGRICSGSMASSHKNAIG